MDPIILVFVAIAAGCVGFLLGFGVRALTQSRTDSDQASDSEQPITSKKPTKRNWTEVANLWRHSSDGHLIFQIEDQTFKRGDELTPREREILLKVVMDFYRWLEPPSAIPSRSEGAETPERAEASLSDLDLRQRLLPPDMRQEILPEEPAKPAPGMRGPSGVIARVLSTTVTPPDTPNLSMVAQVDKILQEKLEAANMQKWAVRLTESPSQGMMVWVGMERYEAIDDVPYQRVRNIIRASVEEWERRAESGESA